MHNLQFIGSSDDDEDEEEEDRDGLVAAMNNAEEAMSQSAQALKQLDQAAYEHFVKVHFSLD